jgi:primosomal protein N' (replication factor Y)
LKQGGGGSTRTAAEIGRSFPGAQIIESTGDNPILTIKSGKRIVISTPGAEPRVAGGYACVVILDAAFALAKDSLRAQDIAIRNWTNAIALLSGDGMAVISGVSQELGQRLALWQLREIASDEFIGRKELHFPPALRLASVQGAKLSVTELIEKLDKTEYEILGPISLRSDKNDIDQRFIIKYQYSQGPKLSSDLKAALAILTTGSTRVGANGRTSRAIRVRMDDPEVI